MGTMGIQTKHPQKEQLFLTGTHVEHVLIPILWDQNLALDQPVSTMEAPSLVKDEGSRNSMKKI